MKPVSSQPCSICGSPAVVGLGSGRRYYCKVHIEDGVDALMEPVAQVKKLAETLYPAENE